MKRQDPALYFSNPRLLCAIYFGVLSVVGTILIDALLTLLGIEEIVPLYQAILIGMIVASATGALFGRQIIQCPRPFRLKTFWIGFTMVLASLPFFALGLVLCMSEEGSTLFSITNFKDLAYTYVMVLAYSYVIFGFFLAIASGIAAVYLRGWLVYDILHTDKRRSMRLPRFVTAHNKAKHAVHRK
jgi:hypothetical protein